MKQQRIFLTRDEALSLCAFSDDDTIHTFRQGGFGLIGCDLSKKELVRKMDETEFMEIAGPHMCSMKHGVALVPKNAQWQSEIIFLETNMDKLKTFERQKLSDNMTWDDLSLEQKQYVIRQYIAIREAEENRVWDDIMSNPNYPEPINWEGVKNCTFKVNGNNDKLSIL